jgi:hypothetical protein
VGGFDARLKPVIASPIGERETLKLTPELMPKVDTEAAALGRNLSAPHGSTGETRHGLTQRFDRTVV